MKATKFLFIIILLIVLCVFGAVIAAASGKAGLGTLPVDTKDTKMSGMVLYEPVSLAGTLYGIQSVVKCLPGTFIMASDETIMLAWPNGVHYSFAFFSKTAYQTESVLAILQRIGWNATKVSTISFTDLVKQLESLSWQYITPDKLPLPLLQAFSSYTVSSMSRLTLLVLPLAIVPVTPTPVVQ